MKGRNSTTVTIRIADSVYAIVNGQAKKRGISINAFIKKKVEEYSEHTSSSVHSVTGGDVSSVHKLLLYNRSIHKTGDRVLVQKGKRLIEVVVPETDIDGNVIFE